MSRELSKLKKNRDALIQKIHKRKIKKYCRDGFAVWIVEGKLVRDFLLTDFGEGGHDRVYTFIPEGEIWLEEVLAESERHFILLHELHERFLMGKGKRYPEAHHGTTIVEDYYRDHPEHLDERIFEELAKNTNQKDD